jgi:hypothetical protein
MGLRYPKAPRQIADGITRVNLLDPFILDGLVKTSDGTMRRTADGYLTAFANVARTGIQQYKGKELGRPDLDVVNVYRPADEVFSRDAMHSMAHKPVTLYHPTEAVTSKNWKDHAGGSTGDEVVRDGDHVRVPLVMMDQGLIDAVEKGGIKELSMGYSTDLKWGRGTTPEGLSYDATQTNIRANHLAVVPVARGGNTLRLDATMAQPNVCPNCGADIPPNADECPACEFDLTNDMALDRVPMKYCTDCGTSMMADAKFCPGCSKATKDGMPPKTCAQCGAQMKFYALACPVCQTPAPMRDAANLTARMVDANFYWIVDKVFTEQKRAQMAKSGAAMPGGRYPIATAADVENAVRDYNRTGQPADVKAHIIARAKAIGATSSLPDGWASKTNDSKGNPMSATITIDGATIAVADELSAAVITKKVTDLSRQLRDAEKTAASAKADKEEAEEEKMKQEDGFKKQIAAKDGEIVALKSQLKDAVMSPEKLDALVKDRAEVVGKSKSFLGDGFTFDGKTLDDIKRAVVASKIGDAEAKTMDAIGVAAAFKVLTAGTDTRDGFGRSGGARDIGFALHHQQSNGQRPGVRVQDAALSDYEKNLNSAWQTKRAS